MFAKQTNTPQSWLAFELNILRRLKFKSAVLPLTGESALGANLKRWNVRVAANDTARWAYTKNLAQIQNNNEFLSAEDLETVLEDAYVPRYKLQNAALRNWFGETDAWWFDNVRQNIEKLASPIVRATALSIGMQAGDYFLSFNEDTREFRRPLSTVYKRLVELYPAPINNGQNNLCTNKNVNEFIAETFGDLMFLRLPPANNLNLRESYGQTAWREEWINGNDEFWLEAEKLKTGKFGTRTETKSQYLNLTEEILRTASHYNIWAIALIEDGTVSAQDIGEIIAGLRRVDTIYTKDFSELTGAKAVIITA